MSMGEQFRLARDKTCKGCNEYNNGICNDSKVFYIGDVDCLQNRENSGLEVNWEESE